MFQDEGRFGRINNPSRCWVPPKERPIVPKQIVREYTYAYIAVSPKDGRFDSLILPDMRGSTMSIFLEEVSSRYKDEHILMIMDGAPCHKCKDLKIPNNIKILHLPSRSPQLNPCENMFDEIREKFFPNLVFDSMDAVEDQMIEALRSLESDRERVRSICGWKWILKNLL